MSARLMAAVPSYDATMILEGVATLLGLQKMLLDRGDAFEFRFYNGASISELRNIIAAEFLDSEADLLLMIDADQAAFPANIVRMIDHGKPVVGCICPKRHYNWAKVTPATGTAMEKLVLQAQEFVGYLETDDQGRSAVIDGFARATYVGSGTMLVRREAFEQLMTRFPELEGRGFRTEDRPTLRQNWGFFNPIDQESGPPFSEDISFCHRWRQVGGEIWADVVGNSVHVGRWPFHGSYFDYLQAMQPD
jgi:hypothetical protein